MSSKRDPRNKNAAGRNKEPQRFSDEPLETGPVIKQKKKRPQRKAAGRPVSQQQRRMPPPQGARPRQSQRPPYRGEPYTQGQRPYPDSYDGYGGQYEYPQQYYYDDGGSYGQYGQPYPPPAREAYAPQHEGRTEIRYEYEPSFFKKHPKIRKLMIRLTVLAVLVIIANLAFLYYRGQLWFNEPRKRDYPVRGAVIDSSLGEVDWKVMSTQNISFTYIRATRGTSFVDEQYAASRKGAAKTKLLTGYFHEFDFHSDGLKQAENFIDTVGDQNGKLRPMVRVSRYGVYYLHMKDADKVKENLKAYLDRLEEEYGRRPVIMCDSKCYEEYIKDNFPKYTLWLMGHFKEPDEKDTHWALWEFNPRVRSSGYEKVKEYYALSVYRRDRDVEDFKKNFIM